MIFFSNSTSDCSSMTKYCILFYFEQAALLINEGVCL